MTTCAQCDCGPCSCRWIKKLETQPHLAGIRVVALTMYPVPLPTVAGERTYHFGGCPCPKCYSLRDASYARGLDRPYPTPPERESWPQLHQPDQEDAS